MPLVTQWNSPWLFDELPRPSRFYDTTANSHEADTIQTVVLTCEQLGLIEDGENVLAIQGHNTNLTSSDFILQPELLAVTTRGAWR